MTPLTSIARWAGLVLALVSGCATLPHEARVKRQAESIVWGALGDHAPALRLRATRVAIARRGDPLLTCHLHAAKVSLSTSSGARARALADVDFEI